MNDKYYKALGVSANCSDDELKYAYETLKKKYSEERFEEGEVGNEAARRLTEIETAYNAILSSRSQQYSYENSGALFQEIEKALKSGDLQTAQQKLDTFDERNAEWHYLQSVVFYKKNWINESKKQLEIASNMSPDVQKYKDALKKMNETVNNAQANANQNSANNGARQRDWNKSGNAVHNDEPIYGEEQQLGGNSCLDWCCQMLACNLLLNCCCNCG